MEKVREELQYKGIKLVSAKLRGKYLGAARNDGQEHFRCGGSSHEEVMQQLRNHVDHDPILSFHDARIIESYRQVDIRCLQIDGQFVARGYVGQNSVLVEKSSVGHEAAISAIKADVDRDLPRILNFIDSNHRRMLEKHGVPSHQIRGARSANGRKRYRFNKCWYCHRNIDNESHRECVQCGWILCPCGACGCSYNSRSPTMTG